MLWGGFLPAYLMQTSLFQASLFVGLLNLSPLTLPEWPEEFVITASGFFRPGGLVAMQLHEDVALTVDGRPIAIQQGLALFGYGREAKGQSELVFSRQGQEWRVKISLMPREYDVQHIDGVDPAYVTPPADVLQRIRAERIQKATARQSQWAKTDLTNGFIWPVRGRISGVYGSQRFYNGEPRRPHYGIDIAAAHGTPVRAMAKGRVSLAEADMYYEGGLVFVDHGLGLVSAYLHLSELAVRVGDVVEQGQVLGRVGTAGRSTGAHLDWRVYWQDKRLDPALLVQIPES